ncbi:MAG: hypothetical protein RR140_02240 [Clostridia bacterium]
MNSNKKAKTLIIMAVTVFFAFVVIGIAQTFVLNAKNNQLNKIYNKSQEIVSQIDSVNSEIEAKCKTNKDGYAIDVNGNIVEENKQNKPDVNPEYADDYYKTEKGYGNAGDSKFVTP